MNNKKIIFILASLQILFFGWIIYQSEQHIAAGQIHKLKLQILDPADPLRGRYMILNFAENRVKTTGLKPPYGKKFYVQLSRNNDGFSVPVNAAYQPMDDKNWLEVSALGYLSEDSSMVLFQYPFDRFFINENAADSTNTFLMSSLQDTNMKCWAEVSIHEGTSILRDVKVNGKSINSALNK